MFSYEFCKIFKNTFFTVHLWWLLLWRAVRKKSNNFFVPKIVFWCSIILLLSTWNTFLCYINFFCWHEILSRATSTRFCRNKITFRATSNFLFQHKIIFRATPNFCFGHRLCHGDIFLLSHSNKNIITSQKINKLSFLCDTKKINFVFCASPFFYIQFLHYTLSAYWYSS